MRPSRNRVLSSIHKGFKKLVAMPLSEQLTSAEARAQRLHDTRHEIAVRKARLKLIIALAKGKRKELLKTQLARAEIEQKKVQIKYLQALRELDRNFEKI